MLEQFLDYYRAVMLRKLDGLGANDSARTPIESTSLTIGGLIKHLALVEDTWFQEVLLGASLPEPWSDAPFDTDPDWDFQSAAEDSPMSLRRLYLDACARSRRAAATIDSLDHKSALGRGGRPISLRWIFVHMIEETARHAGHADLLRESIDGVTGD
jgi:uncharacterized damage-inducible protein DinB